MYDLTEEQEALLGEIASRRQRRPFDTVAVAIFFSPVIGALYIRDWMYAPFALVVGAFSVWTFAMMYGSWWELIPLMIYCALIAGLIPRTRWQNDRIADGLREEFQLQNASRRAVE